MPVPNTFATATTSIPLSQLDANFATAITLGNTAVQLGNTITTINNTTLVNTTISSGNATFTKITVPLHDAGSGNALTLQSNSTTALYIDTSQNVGIGTTSPLAKLNVVTSGGKSTIAIGDTATSTYSQLLMYGGSSKYNWSVGAQYNVNNAFEITPSTAAGGTTFSTPALLIDSSGNVGIGTTSPTARLSVSSAQGIVTLASTTGTNYTAYYSTNTGGGFWAGLESSSGGSIFTGTSAYSAVVGHSGAYPLSFATNNTERMRIDSSGNLLVGLTSDTSYPASGLEMTPNAGASQIRIGHTNGTATGNYYASFSYNSGIIGSISQNGTMGVLFNITSDERLKTNIVDAPSASSIIESIKIRSFDWKSDGSHNRYGVIAQELNQLVPEAVHTPVTDTEMMGVDYSKLVPVLIKYVQELSAEVTALKAKVGA